MRKRHDPSRQRKVREVHRLSDLLLAEQDFRALRRRGTVCSEQRRGTTYFRLRFRTEDGRQRVRYIGNDPGIAETIRRELQDLQLNRQHLVNLKRRVQRMLREALDEPSPVAANLQVNGGDLLEMSLLLKKSIMEAARSSGDVAELKELQPFIDTYVKVCRQADRVLRLKHEITCTQRGDGSPSCRKNRD